MLYSLIYLSEPPLASKLLFDKNNKEFNLGFYLLGIVRVGLMLIIGSYSKIVLVSKLLSDLSLL